MSAIICIFLVFLKSNNFFISSRNLFSPTLIFFINILFQFNIIVKFINSFNFNNNIKIFFIYGVLVFFETPSNPLIELLDINLISYFSKKFNKWLVIDNTFCTPFAQNPILLNSDIVIHSCTKFLDGQSRLLGGVVLSNNFFIIKKLFIFIKILGFNLSVFNAWIIIKSLNTLLIRIKNQNYNSFFILKKINLNYYIYNIFYPNFNLVYKRLIFLQQILNGSLITFSFNGFCLENYRINSWKFLNFLNIISITPNLGDIRTIITHPSTTTHNGIDFLDKFLFLITDSLLRISLGIENVYILLYDFYLSFKNL